jgi:hypothetical protein
MCARCFERQRALVRLKQSILEADASEAREQAAFIVRSSVQDARAFLKRKPDAVTRSG